CSQLGSVFLHYVFFVVFLLFNFGSFTVGLTMMLLRLDCPAGYVCRISRSKSLCIPSKASEFGTKALPTILLAWMAKVIFLIFIVGRLNFFSYFNYCRQLLL